jgi:hypothetical protein
MFELPPEDNPEAIIDWYMKKDSSPNLDEKVAYLRRILSQRQLHIKNFQIGTSIVQRDQGKPWSVNVSVGVNSYHSEFKPKYTPDVLLRVGVFGGMGIRGIETEIPIEWIIYSLLANLIVINDAFPEQKLNYYQILADPYPNHDGSDSRIFFHWFCRYYLGRRGPEDNDMINKWKEKNSLKHRTPLSLVQRQHLLQWGIASESK